MKKLIRMTSRRPRRVMLALLVSSVLGLSACSRPGTLVVAPLTDATPRPSQELLMKIRMDVDGEIVTTTLDDTAVARATPVPFCYVIDN